MVINDTALDKAHATRMLQYMRIERGLRAELRPRW